MQVKRYANSKEYKTAADGWHNATCADIVDLGMQTGKFGTKHKVRIVFVIDETDPDTHEPLLVSDFMTVSIHEASKMARYIAVLLPGSKLGRTFETEELIGRSCRVRTEVHLTKDDRSFANVMAILPRVPGRPDHAVVPIPAGFAREQDKPRKQPGQFVNNHGLEVSDEDVAFPGVFEAIDALASKK